MKTGIELYQRSRCLIQTGDILEWASNTVLGKLIRWKTGKEVNHTGMALLYRLNGAGKLAPGRMCTCEALGDGVNLHFLSDRLKKFKGAVFLLKLKSQYADDRLKIANAAINLEGKGYDYKSLFRNLRRDVRVDRTRLFCSETVQAALIDCGLLDSSFNSGYALVPGEFGLTGMFHSPIRIF